MPRLFFSRPLRLTASEGRMPRRSKTRPKPKAKSCSTVRRITSKSSLWSTPSRKNIPYQAVVLPWHQRARAATGGHGGQGRPLRRRCRHLGRLSIPTAEDSGLTQRFVPPEASSYNDGFKDPEGHWVSVNSLLNSMAYNTQLVKPERSAEKIRRSARAPLEGPPRRQP